MADVPHDWAMQNLLKVESTLIFSKTNGPKEIKTTPYLLISSVEAPIAASLLARALALLRVEPSDSIIKSPNDETACAGFACP